MAVDQRRGESTSLPVAPAVAFVLVWSSGYIAGPYGVRTMGALTLVAWRFALAALVAAALALALRRRPGIDRAMAARIAVVGFVMNGLLFGLMYLGFAAGLSGTLGSLLHSLSPVLTALLAAVILRERLSRVQVVGFVVGVVGVLVVLGPDLDQAGGIVGVALGVLGTLALSLGTLGQRWIGGRPDPIWSATLQFAVSAPPVWVLALATEGLYPVSDPTGAALSLGYLAIANSVLGLLLLGTLVRARGAGAAASLFFLMPPVTAVLEWLVLHRTLTVRELAGLVIAVAGVAVATRRRTPGPTPRTTRGRSSRSGRRR
ncbi:DMT family transporter [Dermatophilaceae bacterium Soc4.6]